MVDFEKIHKFADMFSELMGIENMIWDGAPPVFEEQSYFQSQQPYFGNDRFQQQPQERIELSQRSIKMISQLQPVFQEQAAQLILRGLAAGLRPEISEGLRSQDRQDELYEQGRSTSGQVVTQTRNSMHTKGLAIDVAQLDEKGNLTWNATPGFWEQMGAIGKSLGMNWGGEWKGFQDKPHFQYRANQYH